MPQLYGQDLANGAAEFRRAGRDRGNDGMLAAADKVREYAKKTGAPAAAKPFGEAQGQAAAWAEKADAREMLEGAASIQSLAAGSNLGELFRYRVEKPVTIERQRSAMLPIVGEKVEAEKVAIYNDAVLAKHPLSGLRLVNSTPLDLMQGPVTVFEAGAYAGDARIEDMAPGSERLISYAVDLDVEVNPRMEQRPEEIVAVKIAKGTLVATRKYGRKKVFEIKNSGAKPVKLLVEHPREGGWNLVDPKQPAETTRDRYRFAVAAEPGTPAKLEVAEERPDVQHVALTNLDDNLILFYSRAKVTSPAVKEALEQVVAKQRAIEAIVRAKQEKEREIQVVEQEQNRIRQNMAQLDRTNELYAKYVRKFAEQEDRVEALRKEITALIQKEQEARKAVDEYLLTVTLE
jgi:septum formation topological specificity factor MinE